MTTDTGILKRLVVIDIDSKLIKLVDPKRTKTEEMGTSKCFCHEIDHLYRILSKDYVAEYIN